MSLNDQVHHARRLVSGLVGAGCLVGLAACGSSTPTTSATAAPTATAKPAASASASSSPSAAAITLQQAPLTSKDFTNGATDGQASDTPDLTNLKCSPTTTSGLQQQYKSAVTAASGRIYGNIVAGFDTAADANTYITAYYTQTQTCTDASAAPIQDNFGTYSFYYTIKGSPNDLRVEVVQVGQYMSVVIQLLPDGTQPDQQSLRDFTQASITKLQSISS